MDTLEGVQRQLVKLLSDKRGNSYEEQLKNAGLTSLRDRRVRGDLIETFKVINGMTNIQKEDWFVFRSEEETRCTRANSRIAENGDTERRQNVMFMRNVNLEVRKNFFNVRTIREWNSLPCWVTNSKSVNQFKNTYDKWKKNNDAGQAIPGGQA